MKAGTLHRHVGILSVTFLTFHRSNIVKTSGLSLSSKPSRFVPSSSSSRFFGMNRSSPPSPFESDRLAMTASGEDVDSKKAMSDPPSFVEFLETCTHEIRKEASDPSPPKVYRVFLGNEAGDLDSIVSALASAYVDYLSRPSDANVVHVPLTSIPRTDMKLRNYAVLLLQKCGISASSLLYMDDEPVRRILRLTADGPHGSEVELTLTDHNKLIAPLSHLSDNVVTIMDHHTDEGAHPNVISSNRDIAFQDNVALVGSSCTLVADGALHLADDGIDPGLGLALLGTILVDTINMNPNAGKGTDRDAAAVRDLLSRTRWDTSTPLPDCRALFDALDGARFDPSFWNGLSVLDCLGIDYKNFRRPRDETPFGISSVMIPVADLALKQNFIPDVFRYMNCLENGNCEITLLAAMSIVFCDGVPRRDMMLVGNSEEVSFMSDRLLLEDALKMEEIHLSNHEFDASSMEKGTAIRFFRCGNIKASRKQVAPIMLKHWEELL